MALENNLFLELASFLTQTQASLPIELIFLDPEDTKGAVY